MSNYICKIATKEEILKQFDYEISIHPDNKKNWIAWKEECAKRPDGQTITYFGVLDGEVISEASASISKEATQNADNLIDDKTAYLFAFRTKKEYRSKGYFSILFKYMMEDLNNKGYTSLTVGVEPEEINNKAIYAHLGFTKHIKDGVEIDPDGAEVKVEYYRKER